MNTLDEQIALQQALEQGHPAKVYTPVFGRGAQESAAGFLGRITPYAPDGGDDWTDARYWVREVLATTVSRTECSSRFLPDDPRMANMAKDGRYWVTATNISEYLEAAPGEETHVFGVDRDTPHTEWPLVRVWAVEHLSCGFQYYFDRSLGGSQIRWCIIRALDANNPNVVMVAAVTMGSGGYLIGDVSVPVFVTPGTVNLAYQGLVWAGASVEGANVLPLMFVDGRWYVMQIPKAWLRIAPANIPKSDCNLVI